MTIRILTGDCRDVLLTLPAGSVHCVVTSPPYFGLRDYGHAGQIGLEPTPDQFVAALVGVMREVWRVLREDGVCWINLGDSFAGSPGSGGSAFGPQNVPHKSGQENARRAPGVRSLGAGNLLGIPWRVALALQADGWTLRQAVTWAKVAPMPESVAGTRWERCRVKVAPSKRAVPGTCWAERSPDGPHTPGAGGFDPANNATYAPCPGCPRCAATDGYVLRRGSWRHTMATEMVFMLTRGMSYWADQEAVMEAASDTRGELRFTDRRARGAGIDPSGNERPGQDAARPAGRNPRNWTSPPPSPFSGAHFACVDSETEALTPSGWRHHSDLADGDSIAVYDPASHSWRWGPATFHRYDYDGELVAIDKRDTSQRLTPNHRCLVRSRDGNQRTVEASDLTAGMSVPMAAPCSEASDDDLDPALVALAGWYITEGSHQPGRAQVNIYQSESANPAKCERIRELLKLTGANYVERKREREQRGRPSVEIEWRIHGQIASVLLSLVPHKAMTPRLASLDRPRSELLLEALIDGDGHRRPDGRTCIVQKDRESIDLMQLLALRLGYRAHVSPRAEGGFTLYLTRGDWLTLRGTNGSHSRPGRVAYTGTVWCPSVETGYWIARRNGKPFITGNTYPPKLIEPFIKATCPARACPTCGAGWAPVVEREADNRQPYATVGAGPYSIGSGRKDGNGLNKVLREDGHGGSLATARSTVLGYRPTCACPPAAPVPGVVLDPFLGAGTTALVADRLGRDCIGIELNPEYAAMADARIRADAGMFAEVLR